MKKTISFILSILFCISLLTTLPTAAFAQTQSEDIQKTQLGESNTYYEYNASKKLLTISGSGATPDYSSNGAGQPWYDWRSDSIDKVVIEDGVTVLGMYFLFQVRASEVTLPGSLTQIKNYAFAYTLNMTNWDIPFGVTAIGANAFKSCLAMTDITLPDTLKTIGLSAFDNCTSLYKIKIPYSVTKIGSSCFSGCTSLSDVEFESLTADVSIGSSCFLGCSSLKSLTVPLNASMKTRSFGFESSSKKYSDVTAKVFADSAADTYATAAGIGIEYIDTIPIECAVGYKNTYSDENLTQKYSYTFICEESASYNFYTRGDCDIDIQLSDGSSNLIASCDDIASDDRNGWVKADLTEGEKYIVTIDSYMEKSTGTYTLWVYPDEIISFTVKGTAEAAAAKNMTTVDDSLLDGFVLSIKFACSVEDTVYYNADFFDGTYMKQHESALTCGLNNAYIEIGSVTAPYELNVTPHTYTSSYVNYTEDTQGYTLYTCVLCGDSYKSDYVESPAVKITGKVVLSEDKQGTHNSNYPYKYAKIKVDDVKSVVDRYYEIADDGTFTINTFNNVNITFENENGKDVSFSYKVDNIEPYSTVDYGVVVLEGYDLNGDGFYNVKDLAYFKKYKSSYPDDYFKFFSNFMGR